MGSEEMSSLLMFILGAQFGLFLVNLCTSFERKISYEKDIDSYYDSAWMSCCWAF